MYSPTGREGEPLMRMPAMPQIAKIPTIVVTTTLMILFALPGRPIRGSLHRPVGVIARASFQLRHSLTSLRRSISDGYRATRVRDHVAIPNHDLVHDSLHTVLRHKFPLLNRAFDEYV